MLLPPLLRFGVCWLCLTLSASAAERVVAVFADAVGAETPPPGWAFLWNANGPAHDPSGYAPLERDATSGAYGVRTSGGDGLRPDTPGSTPHGIVSAVREPGGEARAFIAAYTLPEDTAGQLWLTHGNLMNRALPEGARLELFVNTERRWQGLALRDRFATLFQHRLGSLKKGDVVRLVVTPEKAAKPRSFAGRLHFTLEEWPDGQTPPPPAPILSPSMPDSQPQLGSNGRPLPDWLAQHTGQMEALRTRKPELVFVGDSITARWPGELLQAAFGAYRPVNLGIGGDWIQNVRWRLQQAPLAEVRPRLVVLLIGTNNVTHRFTAEEIAAGVASLVATIHEQTPQTRVLIQGILPRGPSLDTPSNAKVREANAALARLADGRAVFYLDVGDTLVEPDGSILPEVMPDRLHVALPGYERWLRVLGPEVERLMQLP